MIVKANPNVTDKEVWDFRFELIKNYCIHHAVVLTEYLTTQSDMDIMSLPEGKAYAKAIERLGCMIQSYIGSSESNLRTLELLNKRKKAVHDAEEALHAALTKEDVFYG